MLNARMAAMNRNKCALRISVPNRRFVAITGRVSYERPDAMVRWTVLTDQMRDTNCVVMLAGMIHGKWSSPVLLWRVSALKIHKWTPWAVGIHKFRATSALWSRLIDGCCSVWNCRLSSCSRKTFDCVWEAATAGSTTCQSTMSSSWMQSTEGMFLHRFEIHHHLTYQIQSDKMVSLMSYGNHLTKLLIFFCTFSGDCNPPVIQGGLVLDVNGRPFKSRFVQNGEMIIFECEGRARLTGVNSTYCIRGQLLHQVPGCMSE